MRCSDGGDLTPDAGLGRVDTGRGDEISLVARHDRHEERAGTAVAVVGVAGRAENRVVVIPVLVAGRGQAEVLLFTGHEVPDKELPGALAS